MATNVEQIGLQKGTNWWGAFVIGLAGTILVTGIAGYIVQVFGAASVPLFAILTATGVLLCFCLAELAAMMPDRTGGLPAYAEETFRPLVGDTAARHIGGISGWAYWLGWFPVAPINMILAASYIIALFKITESESTVTMVATPISWTKLIIGIVGMILLFIPSYLGIRLGAGFATLLGVISMVPLTLIVLLPIFAGKADFSNVAGFALPEGTVASFGLYAGWSFIMLWSVLAMEAAACYIGECRNPARDAKIAMTAEGLYGFFIYVMVPLVFVAVLGQAETFDPLTLFTQVTETAFGSGSIVTWIVGIPLVVALLLSVLNAIMGVGRSLYQLSEDRLIPRFFGKLNSNGVPATAMLFNVVCSIGVLFFGSPLEIFIFSNMGYLLACALAFVGYAVYRIRRPDVPRPVRMPGWLAYPALIIGVLYLVLWLVGGYVASDYAVGPDRRELFWIGLIVIALYFPLYWWRRAQERA
jgi:amino acid transporter